MLTGLKNGRRAAVKSASPAKLPAMRKAGLIAAPIAVLIVGAGAAVSGAAYGGTAHGGTAHGGTAYGDTASTLAGDGVTAAPGADPSQSPDPNPAAPPDADPSQSPDPSPAAPPDADPSQNPDPSPAASHVAGPANGTSATSGHPRHKTARGKPTGTAWKYVCCKAVATVGYAWAECVETVVVPGSVKYHEHSAAAALTGDPAHRHPPLSRSVRICGKVPSRGPAGALAHLCHRALNHEGAISVSCEHTTRGGHLTHRPPHHVPHARKHPVTHPVTHAVAHAVAHPGAARPQDPRHARHHGTGSGAGTRRTGPQASDRVSAAGFTDLQMPTTSTVSSHLPSTGRPVALAVSVILAGACLVVAGRGGRHRWSGGRRARGRASEPGKNRKLGG